MVEQVIKNVENRIERIAKSQEQVTTGLRVNKPSDDPAAAGEIIRLNRSISRLDQYRRNIGSGISSLRMTESALGQIRDVIIQTRSLAVKGANGALAEEDRRALAEEVDQAMRELLRIANQKFGGRYLFGGTETRSKPYQAVENDDGRLENITAQFDETQNNLELIFGEKERVEITFGASDTFYFGNDEDLFGILFDLRQALEDNDADATGEALPRLDDALDQMNAVASIVGARVQSAENLLSQYETRNINLVDRVAELGDVDILKAIIRLNEDQTSYELALRMSAKVIQPSLVNFVYL